MKFELPRIYPIADPSSSGLSQAEQVTRLIAGGAWFIQLREKHASSAEFYAEAVEAIAVARKKGVRIIINDRVDIALAAGADGVHLGQDDLPPAEARKILGEDAIIGFSTHSVEQARLARGLPIDYIAIGPIFPTNSKEKADKPLGIEVLKEVRLAVGDNPLVAIGGISRDDLEQVLLTGVDSVAMIGDLVSSPEDIENSMREALIMANTVVPR